MFILVWAAMGWYGILSNEPIFNSLDAPGLDPGPGALPAMVCSALTLGGLWLLFAGLMRADAGIETVSIRRLGVPFGFLASAIVAAFLVNLIGFRLVGFGFAILWLHLLDSRQLKWWRKLLTALVLAALIIALIEAVFVQLLLVPLP
jgi:ABC-type uncharacterized transport system permease subunit